jgi:hypothetical protein
MQQTSHRQFDQDHSPAGGLASTEQDPTVDLPPPPLPGLEQHSSGKRGKAWERGWAIVGIVWAFTWFVIPGVYGIVVFRGWQKGERNRPSGLIWFGILYTAYFVGLSLLFGFGGGGGM